MSTRGCSCRFLFTFWILASTVTVHSNAAAQAPLKKVRLGIAATSVGFLPIYTAYHRGFLQRRRHRPRNHFDVPCGRQQCFLQGRDRLQRGFDGFGLGRGAKLSREDLDLYRRQTAPVIRQSQRDQRSTRSPGQESRRQLARRLGDHTRLSGAQALRPRTRKGRYRHTHGGLRRGSVWPCWSRGWSMRLYSLCRKTSSPRKKAITS